jgi:ABC-type phosphate/phosphonate transport system substrate-binding protein
MLEMNTAEKISQSKPIDDAMPEEVGIEVDFQPIKEF